MEPARRYNGHVSSRQLHWEGRYIHPVAFDFDSDLALERISFGS